MRWLSSALGNSQRGPIAVLSQQHCVHYKVCTVRGEKEGIAHFIKDDQRSSPKTFLRVHLKDMKEKPTRHLGEEDS